MTSRVGSGVPTRHTDQVIRVTSLCPSTMLTSADGDRRQALLVDDRADRHESASAAPCGADSVSLRVSFPSWRVSPATTTSTGTVVAPGSNLIVCGARAAVVARRRSGGLVRDGHLDRDGLVAARVRVTSNRSVPRPAVALRDDHVRDGEGPGGLGGGRPPGAGARRPPSMIELSAHSWSDVPPGTTMERCVSADGGRRRRRRRGRGDPSTHGPRSPDRPATGPTGAPSTYRRERPGAAGPRRGGGGMGDDRGPAGPRSLRPRPRAHGSGRGAPVRSGTRIASDVVTEPPGATEARR